MKRIQKVYVQSLPLVFNTRTHVTDFVSSNFAIHTFWTSCYNISTLYIIIHRFLVGIKGLRNDRIQIEQTMMSERSRRMRSYVPVTGSILWKKKTMCRRKAALFHDTESIWNGELAHIIY